MNLTIGILTSNAEHLIGEQLASLEAGLSGVDDWQLVICDSGSTDRTVELARELAPKATVVELPGNPGFAAQANAVIAAEPRADAILIMSRTTRLHPGCAGLLLRALATPGVGVAVPRLINRHGQAAPSLRRRPTLRGAWLAALIGGRGLRRLPEWAEMVPDPESYSADTRFDWATGAVTLFSAECAAALGGWDESFFLYSEETDFALRAADHGYAIRFVPDAVATHLGGESKQRPEFWAHTVANRVRLYGMRHRRPAAASFWTASLVGEVIRLPSRPVTRRAAIVKLLREGPALIAGRPARKPPERS